MPPTQLGKGIAQGCCSPPLKALDTLIPASQTPAAYRLGVVTDPCGAVPWWGPRQGTPCSRAHRPHPLRARTCANHGTHEHVNKYVYSHTHHCLSHGSHVHLYVCVCVCACLGTQARLHDPCAHAFLGMSTHMCILCACACASVVTCTYTRAQAWVPRWPRPQVHLCACGSVSTSVSMCPARVHVCM